MKHFFAFIICICTSFVTAATDLSKSYTDSEIGQIFITLNQVAIEAAKNMRGSTMIHPVNQFANYMRTDHLEMKKEIINFFKKNNLSAKENDLSRNLKEEGQINVKEVNELKGEQRAKLYIENEVKFHNKSLEIFSRFLPQVDNINFRILLESAQTTYERHLEHVQKVQTSLSK